MGLMVVLEEIGLIGEKSNLEGFKLSLVGGCNLRVSHAYHFLAFVVFYMSTRFRVLHHLLQATTTWYVYLLYLSIPSLLHFSHLISSHDFLIMIPSTSVKCFNF